VVSVANRYDRAAMGNVLRNVRSVLDFRMPETDLVARRLTSSANVADLRRIARRRLPRGVFDYIDGAAEDERTMASNALAFERRTFVPQILVDVTDVDTSTTVLGKRLPFPLALAPTGFSRIAHSQGELSVARAAAKAGVPYSLSTMATRSIEEVAAVSSGSKWFQVYMWKDRGLIQSMVERAAASGYEAIMITVDTAVLGRRERDVRRGFAMPPKIGPRTIIDGIVHPGWTWDFVRAEPILFANLSGGADGTEAVTLAEFNAKQFDTGVTWDAIDWMRTIWRGPIILKGVQSVADARRAVDHGIEAVLLSNHGGRQLDHAPATLDLVAPVADAVGDRTEILVDGGVRRGSDIIKAVALGARACLIGRPYLYGLGAAGERGVSFVLDRFRDDMVRTMSLCGVTSIADLTPDLIASD
jgi:L-lactate dehydrogenase (cytochrome)